jgi:hypothetical protein
MSVLVEKLDVPAPSLFVNGLARLGSATGGVLRGLWHRPFTMVMSEDWLIDRVRIESKQGWY